MSAHKGDKQLRGRQEFWLLHESVVRELHMISSWWRRVAALLAQGDVQMHKAGAVRTTVAQGHGGRLKAHPECSRHNNSTM